MKGFRNTKETVTTRSNALCFKALVKLKERKVFPQSLINKREKESEIMIAHSASVEEARELHH